MSRWSELRRALAHAVAAESPHSPVTEVLTVPFAVRGRTADGADVRLLVEATLVADAPRREVDLERIAHALVLPAARGWLAVRVLDRLAGALGSAPADLEAATQPGFETVGARLLRIELVAVEHLLASPSAAPDAGEQQ